MASVSRDSANRSVAASRTSLSRILGLGFGIAVIFGGTVGVGILRLPGTIAGQLQSFSLIMLVWVLGGCYALLGAISVAELGAAMPQAGGFYIYSKRAFGTPVGFAVGWADWLNNCAVVAYAAVAAAEYLVELVPGTESWQTSIALALLVLFCALHWIGLRLSSSIQKLTSSVTAITFLFLAAACLLDPAQTNSAVPAGFARGGGLLPTLVPLIAALRAIVVTYDGWYEAIYFTEEDTDAAKHLPRAMIGGVVIVMGLYLLMNVAFLHVLSVPALAASKLPAADAARIVFPTWSGRFVTVLSLLTLLSLIHAVLLGAPRILLAIGRDGLFTERAARVGAGGTPRVALLLSAATSAILIASGSFEAIIAVAAILVAAMYCVNYIAVIVLRFREPDMVRPFRAWGYPVTTVLVLAASLAFLIAAVRDDPVSAWRAAVLLAVAVPVYVWMRRKQRASGQA
ncbi:MAG: APC family permease [Silvibacterium sp.]|jgi:APA family basic amino acid/polyamine antiporter